MGKVLFTCCLCVFLLTMQPWAFIVMGLWLTGLTLHVFWLSLRG